MKDVIITIPVYTTDLLQYEILAIKQCTKILRRYDIAFVCPNSLNTKELEDRFRIHRIERFGDSYFKSQKTYNELMLSSSFYERFLGYSYTLLYQTDAWVFKDELEDWCAREYDYIGAPWTRSWAFYPWYRSKKYKRILRRLVYRFMGAKSEEESFKRLMYSNYVGNGGFSLRRNSRLYCILEKYGENAGLYLNRQEDYYNEDVFWGLEAKFRYGLKTPKWREAIAFSVESYPVETFRLLKRTPFGCHAWPGWPREILREYFEDQISSLLLEGSFNNHAYPKNYPSDLERPSNPRLSR